MNNHRIVEVEQVNKEYLTGDEVLPILRAVDLSVERGETVSIAGASGCGKSTLLNMISGMDHPTGGRVWVDGVEVSSLNENRAGNFRSRVLGMVFQSHHLLRDFTILENTALPALIAGSRKEAAWKKAGELLEKVGIKQREHHYPNAVSGGERQRAAVARALVNGPELILADEPTGNLDEMHSAEIQQLLFDVVRDTGAALVLVTHDRFFARRADRCYVLQHGLLEAG